MTYFGVELLTDQQIKGIYDDVYNRFWRRYCTNPPARGSKAAENEVEQAKILMERYHSCPMVVHMIQDLMDQLEGRKQSKGAENE